MHIPQTSAPHLCRVDPARAAEVGERGCEFRVPWSDEEKARCNVPWEMGCAQRREKLYGREHVAHVICSTHADSNNRPIHTECNRAMVSLQLWAPTLLTSSSAVFL